MDTTADWEALLDGATPGPWEAEDRSPRMGGRTFIIRQKGAPGCLLSGATYAHDGIPELLAAAPDAVAEVIRLRRGIEASIAQYQFIQTFVDHPQALGVLGQIIPDLTRILEGNTNE